MKTYLGRKVESVHDFKKAGTFESLYAAHHFLTDNDYSYGSLCHNEPVGLIKGYRDIPKWKNLDDQDKKELDGVMVSTDFREDGVRVILFSNE